MSARPTVVGLHRAHRVSGVTVTGARLARLAACPVRPMMVGAGVTVESVDATPLSGAPGLSLCAWPGVADPAAQAVSVRDALLHAEAQVVVPNDLVQGFIACALLRRRGVRCAAWCHGDDLMARDLYERCLPLADAWRAVSGSVARAVGRSGGGTLPCPIDVPDAPAPANGPGPLRLLYAGWLDGMNKRVLDLAALADGLHGRGIAFELTIVGDGPSRGGLERALRGHVAAGRARLLGPAPLGRMGGLHRAHDALVLVSRSEGWPLVVMEAMAAGRAVAITGGCGGATDLVRDGVEGVVVPVGAMDEMAGRLGALAGDRAALARMGVAAHAAALRSLDARVLGPRFAAFVEEAAGAPETPEAREPGAIASRWRVMLGALELLGECPARSLGALARWWLGDLGVRSWRESERGIEVERGVTLPVHLPDLPTAADRLVLEAVARLVRGGVERIALYGAGRHTRRVRRAVERTPAIVAIVDDRAGEADGPPGMLFGRPVVTPDGASRLGVEAVVISSDEHEPLLLRRAGEWAGDRPVVPLYARAG
ncbi:MAG: glycosyltransferase family 4 protein [Phycisphaerales bacterium]|nr:glycosyltransferase family 4 protein [Phycisphaerales bacterium]